MKLASIFIYPVKSMAGHAMDAAAVEPWGLQHDRRWVVLEPDGSALTARREHRLLAFSAWPTPDGIVLSIGNECLTVHTPIDGLLVEAAISRLESVRVASDEANAWLASRLGRSVRLGWLDNPALRIVSPRHGGRSGDVLSLADAGPLLLTSNRSFGSSTNGSPRMPLTATSHSR